MATTKATKKATKKAAKKTIKKTAAQPKKTPAKNAAKKNVKKTAAKLPKKPVKKAAAKSPKKPAKKAAAKSPKKPAKKAAKKTSQLVTAASEAPSVALWLKPTVVGKVLGLRFWVRPKNSTEQPLELDLNPNTYKARIIATVGVEYKLGFQFSGNPGDSVAFVVEDPEGKPLVKQPALAITDRVPEGTSVSFKA